MPRVELPSTSPSTIPRGLWLALLSSAVMLVLAGANYLTFAGLTDGFTRDSSAILIECAIALAGTLWLPRARRRLIWVAMLVYCVVLASGVAFGLPGGVGVAALAIVTGLALLTPGVRGYLRAAR